MPKKTIGKKSALDQELSSEDLSALRSAIHTITQEKGNKFVNEHDVLHELRQELVDYEEDLGEMKEIAESAGRKNLKQTKGAARLFKMVNTVLGRADTVVKKLETRESKLRIDIDSLNKVGEDKEDQEEHLVTVQDLLGAVRGLQQVPDSEMLERISEVVASMDEDSDGIVKLEHVNKVIEILGSDNVEMSGKQIKQIIDLIGKEEMLEVESRIEKILGKMPVLAVTKPVIEKDITEKQGDAVLVDKAEELNVDKVEPHIAEMFSRKPSQSQDSKEADIEDDHDTVANGNIDEDNSVKDVTDSVKERLC